MGWAGRVDDAAVEIEAQELIWSHGGRALDVIDDRITICIASGDAQEALRLDHVRRAIHRMQTG